jgi:hypothetical protein
VFPVKAHSDGTIEEPSNLQIGANYLLAAGSTTQLQYNNAGALGGTSSLTYTSASGDLVNSSAVGAAQELFQLKNPSSNIASAVLLNLKNDTTHALQLAYTNSGASSAYLTNGPTSVAGYLSTTAAEPLVLGTNAAAALVFDSSQNETLYSSTVKTKAAVTADKSGNWSTVPATVGSTDVQFNFANADTASNTIESIAWGVNSFNLRGRAIGGTRGTPSQTTDGQNFISLSAFGWDSSNTYGTAAKARFDLVADGAWTGSNNGVYFVWSGTPNASISRAEWLRLQGAKLTISSATGGLGYGSGSGSTIAQATSRTTGVTINTPSGAITLVSAAGSATFQTFVVSDSSVAATDTVIVNEKSGTDKYEIFVTAVTGGTFNITFATTGGTTTETPVFNFCVIKGSSS